jgi:bifunctional NMN adenylyltransferase/nudix hydrolase
MPGKGLYALPGGFLEQHETVYQSALRELLEETGLAIGPEQALQYLKAVQVFDHPSRSQRGGVISHTHHFELPDGFNLSLNAGDDAVSAQWMAYDEVVANADGFHDDHFFMLESFLPLSFQPQLLKSQQVLS